MSSTYDIIFAGGERSGTTACVVAGRLAEADPSLKILILEAGLHSHNLKQHTQPGRAARNLHTHSKAFSVYVTQPAPSLNNRPAVLLSGRAVGGGSTVNFVSYTRAAASDYDDWEQIYGNKGWGSADLIPLSKKAETYQGEPFNQSHGTGGPIKVSHAQECNGIGEDFLQAASEFDTARTTLDDMNDFTSVNGYARWARYIDQSSGRRSDTATHYIYDKTANTNLKVLDGHRVIRILFDNKRAVGVEYISDAGRHDEGFTADIITAYASKLVVVSAGAYGSPAILERSGIGAKSVLERNGVEQIVDLPGVGENFMDHVYAGSPYHTSEDAETVDLVSKGSEADIAPYDKQWDEHGTGPFANNIIDAGIKLRPVGGDFAEIGPQFDHQWKTYFADKPDKPVVALAAFGGYSGTKAMSASITAREKYFSFFYFITYPITTGHVHITHGKKPYSPLDIAVRFVEHPGDLGLMRWVYKHSREIARRMRYYRGEVAADHPNFTQGSAAACKPAQGPVPMSSPKIAYTPEDDKAIDDFHRASVGTIFHSCGTCAMKTRESGGVVNEKLDVYGVQNLKVADLSIAPSNVGANTYNTAIVIGEKAASIIAAELGLPPIV